MKNAKWLVILMGVVALSACGSSDDGGGGGSTAEAQAEAAFNDFGNAIEECFATLGAQVVDDGLEADADVSTIKETATCTCPGGGTITADDVTGAMTIDSCISATGETYAGEFTSTDGGATIDGDMTRFGACASGAATGVGTGTCAGSIVTTCPAGRVTCTITDDAGGEDECDLTCS